MGLALNFVPYTQERLVANEALIADYDSDVICMQEVWLEDHVDAIEQALAGNYPYIYTVEPEQIFSENAACTNEEIAGFADCAETQCPGLSGNDLVACAGDQCGDFLGGLSSSCLDGVLGAVGIPDITVEILVDTVTQPAGKFTFDGSLGLMLASKYELLAREFQDFIDDSSTLHRGALYAEIEVNKQTHVLGCTHPTANLSADIFYPPSGKHDSWEGENRFMQEQMITFVNDKAGDKPIFFGGDFNCSIANASNGVDADFPDNCRLWLTDGFTDPAADQLPCTFCEDENLILQGGQGDQKEGDTGHWLLDHVFVKNLETADAIVAERIFDDPVSIEALIPPSELEPEDSPMLTHPSDHFGVELDIPLP
jgi:endonuclease/exonuclease/phosphatase family metal-dependent hydrolase